MTHLFPLLLALQVTDAPTGAVKLLAGSMELTKVEGKVATLDGVVERIPGIGRAGAPSSNLFRLRYQDADGKETIRELFVGDVGFRVSDHVGKKMRVHGKLVESKRESGVVVELWPAWMQPLSGALVLGVDGVFTRCDWQPEEARKRGSRQFLFRSGEQLAEAMKINGATAAQSASEQMARRLGVPAIDWSKHMLICVSAGLQTTIEGVSIAEVREEKGSLRVSYRLVPARGGGVGFGYPAQTALVPRSTAEVRFEQEAKTPKK